MWISTFGSFLRAISMACLTWPAVAAEVSVVRREPLAAVVRLDESLGLDHRPHRAIDHGDTLLEERAQAGFGGHGAPVRRAFNAELIACVWHAGP